MPRGVGAALRRALSEAPADRFPSLELLLRALTPPRRRRWWWAAGGAGLIAGGVAVAVVTRVPAAAACTDLDRGLVGIWDPDRREAVRRAFAGSGLASAAEAAQLVSAGLDRYAASWSAARVDTCEAAQVRREQTPAQQELRTVCLDERLAELRAVSDLVVAPDREIVTNAHALLASLTPPSACADLAALSERLPVAGAHHQVAAIRGLRSGLARIRAVVAAGQLDAAARDLARLRPEIERTAYRPLEAEAALTAGQLAGKQGYLGEADAQVRAAVLAAEAGRDIAPPLVAAARAALRGADPDAARIAATWLRSQPRR